MSCTIGRTSTPGWSIGTSRYDSPSCRLEPGSVRATHEAPVGQWASDVHTFWPLITHWSPSSRALVEHVGQVGAGAGLGVALAPQLARRRRIVGRNRCCCSSVPNAISVGPSSSSPKWLTRPGASARAYSSWKITCCAERQPAAAVLVGPAEAGQPCGGEVLVPGQPLVEAPRARGPGPPRPLSVGELADRGCPRASRGPRRGTPRPRE